MRKELPPWLVPLMIVATPSLLFLLYIGVHKREPEPEPGPDLPSVSDRFPPVDEHPRDDLRSRQGEPPSRLTGDDDGYAWNRSSYTVRMSLCESMARKLSGVGSRSRGPTWYYEFIQNFYNSDPKPEILRQRIDEMVAAGVTIDESK